SEPDRDVLDVDCGELLHRLTRPWCPDSEVRVQCRNLCPRQPCPRCLSRSHISSRIEGLRNARQHESAGSQKPCKLRGCRADRETAMLSDAFVPNRERAAAANADIPIIDISPFFAGGKRTIVDAIARACEEVGFFGIVGHGVHEDTIAAIYR